MYAAPLHAQASRAPCAQANEPRLRPRQVMQYKNAGLYFRGKGGDAKSSSSYRDEQIAQLQVERRANRY